MYVGPHKQIVGSLCLCGLLGLYICVLQSVETELYGVMQLLSYSDLQGAQKRGPNSSHCFWIRGRKDGDSG